MSNLYNKIMDLRAPLDVLETASEGLGAEYWFAKGHFEARYAAAELVRAERGWRSVEKDGYPQPGFWLVYREETNWPATRFFNGITWDSSAKVTHWMPLPSPPNEEGE